MRREATIDARRGELWCRLQCLRGGDGLAGRLEFASRRDVLVVTALFSPTEVVIEATKMVI